MVEGKYPFLPITCVFGLDCFTGELKITRPKTSFSDFSEAW